MVMTSGALFTQIEIILRSTDPGHNVCSARSQIVKHSSQNPSQIYSIQIHRFRHKLGTIPFNVARIIIQQLTNCLNLPTSRVPIFIVGAAGTSITGIRIFHGAPMSQQTCFEMLAPRVSFLVPYISLKRNCFLESDRFPERKKDSDQNTAFKNK